MNLLSQIQIKYLLDRCFGILGVLVCLPLGILIALAIKLDDRGPVFFRQVRLGLNARSFTIWKFRTMIPDADSLLDAQGRVGNTNRITRVGRLLRMTSLDELPQLINILKGEMSFVGPRPVLPSHLPRYTEFQKQRFRMKPGVTGLAQVNGRNQLKWSERIRLDVEYINTYSPALDLKILIRTAGVVFRREGIALDRNPEQVDDLA